MSISAYDEALSLVQRLSTDDQRRLLETLATIAHDESASEQQTASTPATPLDEAQVEGYDPATDPLARFAGIYASDEPGWLNRHDGGADD